MTKTTPRGLRNNNPLNIRKSADTFLGEVTSDDKEFKKFKTAAYGYRAGFRILRNYVVRYKITTVAGIIARWAPSNENNTSAYTATVCKRSGLASDAVVDPDNKALMTALVAAMSYVECGVAANEHDVSQGYDLL